MKRLTLFLTLALLVPAPAFAGSEGACLAALNEVAILSRIGTRLLQSGYTAEGLAYKPKICAAYYRAEAVCDPSSNPEVSAAAAKLAVTANSLGCH